MVIVKLVVNIEIMLFKMKILSISNIVFLWLNFENNNGIVGLDIDIVRVKRFISYLVFDILIWKWFVM